MTPPLFLLDELPVVADFALDGAEGRHASRVKRIAVDETVLVGDGRGALVTCTVTRAEADALALHVETRSVVALPDPRIVVVQALPKGERAELAVEMLTELGVDEIVPWQSARSIVRWSGPRGARSLERWRRTAREAAKQSRRAWLPIVAPLAGTDEVTLRLRAATGAFVLHEDAERAFVDCAVPATGEVVVVIGPEGGIAPAELDAFVATRASAVRLGPEVLRTSTAGPAFVAALSARLGRWDQPI